MEISVVVPTYERVGILRRSLPTILGQDLEAGRFEVVVVVDGSTDGTTGFLRNEVRHPAMRVVEQPNRGLAAARNRGAREARGRLVLFLDDDAHASPGLARAHVGRHADEPPRVVQGAFPLLPAARRSFLSVGVERWSQELTRRLSAPGYRPRFADASFANASMPRAVWESTGGFRESFRRFGNEDYDYALRLTEAGVELVFEPSALAWQDYRKSFRRWWAEWYDVGRADVQLWRLHPRTENELGFARIAERHALRRAVLRAALRGSRTPSALVAPVGWTLMLADRLGLRGRPWDLLKWLPADASYARGVHDALREAETTPPSLAGLLPPP